MKIILLVFSLTITLYADKNWIPIEPLDKTSISKEKTNLDTNTSNASTINTLLKNSAAIKQIIKSLDQDEEVNTSNKNWYELKDTASNEFK